MAIIVESIHYYPIKGLGGTTLRQADIGSSGLAHDRRFGLAFTDADDLFKEGTPWRPWNYFISLKKYTRPVKLAASAAEEGNATILTLRTDTGEQLSGNPADSKQRRALEIFIGDFLECPPPQLVDSPETPLWDEKATPVSLINSASVAELAEEDDELLQNERFRANIVFSAVAWHEEHWRGTIAIGDVLLNLTGGIPRCAATTVNTDTAQRDRNIPELLLSTRGHNELGLFAQVQQGGTIAAGWEIDLEPSA